MCAGSGGTGGGGTGQSAGFQPWMGYGGGMSQQSPMGSGALQSAGMGMGAQMQRQSPWMGSGGGPNQAQMGKVDRFAGLGGAPMPTGDVFSQQQAYAGGDPQAQLMGAQGAYNGAMQAGPGQMSQTFGQQSPMDLQTSQLQRAMSPWMQQAGGQQRQSPFMGMNPDFNQIVSALQGMGGRQV